MARILFAWELGGDYGHLSRLLPLARELAARGHQPFFAVRDLLHAEALLGAQGFRWLQAPLWLGQLTNLPAPISYPELLMRFGFINAQALTGICRAWRNLIDLSGPTLLVLDHAPTALLATRGLGIPRMNFGDGFCIPPATGPLPPFSWWERPNKARLADSERHALQSANQVLSVLGEPAMADLGELLHAEATLLATFAELDHYPSRDDSSFIGPVFALGKGVPPAWPRADRGRVFAYVKPGYVEFAAVLNALHGLQASVLVHAPGVARRSVAELTSARMAFSAEPVDIDAVRSDCDLAVCHGGAGTTAAMLLAGKPLLLLPTQMEQTMLAKRIAAIGAASTVPPESIRGLGKSLQRAIADGGLRDAARKFADRHAGYDQGTAIRIAADRCEALLGTA